MNTSLRQLRDIGIRCAQGGQGSAARSLARITLLALIAFTTLGLLTASAQHSLKLRDGFVNEVYTFSFADVVKGEGDGARWKVTQGSLPSNFNLSEKGVLTGTPTRQQVSEFEVEAKLDNVVTFQTKASLQIQPAGFDVAQLDQTGASDATEKVVVFCDPPQSSFILASSTADLQTIALTEDANTEALAALNTQTLEILDVNKLIRNTLGNTPAGTAAPTFKAGDYLIIHLAKWKPVQGGTDKSDGAKDLWPLYELVDRGKGQGLAWEARMNPDDRENFDTRIFGSRRVAVLLLHLQTPRTWDVKYTVKIDERVPEPIQNAFDLASFIGGTGTGKTDCVPAPTRNLWGGRMIHDRHTASDIVVKLNTVTSNSNGEPVSQSKEYSKSYRNEGRYHWDVSVGMPVRSIKEIEFSSENGTVTAKKKEKQNAYGFLNLFPRAVDLQGKSFLTSPHFVLGVPISGKPLDRPVIGIGTGLYTKQFKLNFFAGVAFNRIREPRALAAGDSATANQLENDLRTRRVTKFVFGINFPVRQFIAAVKGK